ncbi:putative uncharacterized protein DDB_G0290521 isoform X2 [Harpegnathos saltator]|uniref:putative uncharacterized protein DDB_G0290521 isoform X2 n=1 Tax=Harpegnathos saltator TaxID=610380 RepID=UPI00058EE315|nr:putative uncharacterized protein DDB_G0290521 isoform X2 [Harpegnathos saltator]
MVHKERSTRKRTAKNNTREMYYANYNGKMYYDPTTNFHETSTFAPQTFAPQTFMPQMFMPQTFGPQTFEMQRTLLPALAPQTFAPAPQPFAVRTIVPETIAPRSIAPRPIVPQAIAPQRIDHRTFSPQTLFHQTQSPQTLLSQTAALLISPAPSTTPQQSHAIQQSQVQSGTTPSQSVNENVNSRSNLNDNPSTVNQLTSSLQSIWTPALQTFPIGNRSTLPVTAFTPWYGATWHTADPYNMEEVYMRSSTRGRNSASRTRANSEQGPSNTAYQPLADSLESLWEASRLTNTRHVTAVPLQSQSRNYTNRKPLRKLRTISRQ